MMVFGAVGINLLSLQEKQELLGQFLYGSCTSIKKEHYKLMFSDNSLILCGSV